MNWTRLIEGILVGYLFVCTFRTFGVRRRVNKLEKG